MRYNKWFLVLVLSIVLHTVASAAPVTVPYKMSFEQADAAELALWQLNTGSDASLCEDQWVVGNALRSDGKRSLYIVAGGQTEPSYGSGHPNVQFCYRDFELQQGSYYVSFDWLNEGPETALMYVGYVVYTTGGQPSMSIRDSLKADSQYGTMPQVLSNPATTTGPLYGSASWRPARLPNPIAVRANQTIRLYVAFANNNMMPSNIGAGAAIDNIEITNAAYPMPSNLTVRSIDCDSVEVTWYGGSTGYELIYRASGSENWSKRSSFSNNPGRVVLEYLPEGAYEFRVRNTTYDVDGNLQYSAYCTTDEFVVYCPERRCVDYINLNNLAQTTCYIGDYQPNTYNVDLGSVTSGAVDFGPNSYQSRHTVVYDRNGGDPRTGGKMKMVPSGAVASVRLHTWQPTGHHYSAIEYTLDVDSTNAILLFHYALVQQYSAEHHPADPEQARFYVQVLDAITREPVDPACGQKTLRAGYDSELWEWQGKATGTPLTTGTVVWKDWTPMGMNLSDYIGQTVILHIEASGCSQQEHYGYAYFTLDCMAAELTIDNCSAVDTVTVEAPEGFRYTWYRTTQPDDTLSQKRYIRISDQEAYTYTYACTLTDIETSCSFTLTTEARPRYPMADFYVRYDPANCQNRCFLVNQSYVYTKDSQGKPVRQANMSCGGYQWLFGDDHSTDGQKDCQHIFPREGGTFPVTLSTWIGNGVGACRKDTTIEVNLPALKDEYSVIDTTICEHGYVKFDGKYCTEEGEYVQSDTTEAGCDRVTTLRLHVRPTYEITLPDTSICYSSLLCLGEDCYYKHETGTWSRMLSSVYDCDSLVSIAVTVEDEIVPTVSVTQMSETELEASVTVGGTGWSQYSINGQGAYDADYVFRTDVPGTYEYRFMVDGSDCDSVVAVQILPTCLRNLIYQRWNDVLSLKNMATQMAETGHAVDMVAFQWVCNDEEIPGATDSYYYAPDGLIAGATYTCRVVLADGTEDETCPFVPQINPQPKAAPAASKMLQNSRIYIIRGEQHYTIEGLKMKN